MSRFQQQQQIIRHTKKQESMTHAERQNIWIEMIPEEDQMPDLTKSLKQLS